MSRIDDFKSQASRAGGFSAQNLFKVTLPRIAGAPLGGSNPRELNMLCRAMNIPGTSTVYRKDNRNCGQESSKWICYR